MLAARAVTLAITTLLLKSVSSLHVLFLYSVLYRNDTKVILLIFIIIRSGIDAN